MSQELPRGWAEGTLRNIGDWCTGGTPSRGKREYFGKGVPWVKSGDLPDGPILKTAEEITRKGLAHSSAKLMPEGTISMALYGATIGKLGIMTFTAATNQACANVIPNKRIIDPCYLFFFLLSERQCFIDEGQGGAQPNISQGIVRDHPILIAPLNEQRRIVAKLEKLLDKVNACQKRLEKIPKILKRFRQSVLAAACSGRLTADWREQNEQSDEWDETILDEVSETIQIGPFGSQLHRSDYVPRGIPLINPTHIKDSRVVHDNQMNVSREKFRELAKYALAEGDVIMARRGEMGRCALITKDEDGWLCGTGSLLVRPKEKVSSRFLFLFLRSERAKRYLENESLGTTMDNLNSTIIANVPVTLPPFNEQEEIVRRVDALFAMADQIEAPYSKAKAQVNKLMKSILAKAFRGELVPQDPNDEPASVLLERIKTENRERTKKRTLTESHIRKTHKPQKLPR